MALKKMTADEAAQLINHNDNVGFSGFTHAGCPKAVPAALARRAADEHAKGNPFQVGMFTGASTGDSIDGELSRAKAIKFRTPYQTNKDIRNAINNGEVKYFDQHLSMVAQDMRYGYFGEVDFAIIEAADITEDGEIVPTSGVGITPTIVEMAKTVIVELNAWHPKELKGIHDLINLQDPPARREIPIYKPSDRIGCTTLKVDPSKIIVVETNIPNEGGGFAPVDEITTKIGENAANFLVNEIKSGRLPKTLLPIQSGVGNIANAVLKAMGDNKEIPSFEVYTEVIQEAVIDMIEEGHIKFASGGSFTVGNDCMERIYSKLDFFKERVVLRPSEITNHPEVVRRIGVIAMNTAIEADIFGNINSTHIVGSKLMNGVGGSGDFTRNAFVSIFLTPSVAKEGKISAIVPAVSHTDHNEHSVNVIISEYGVADLRGKDPKERALTIIENCAHPDYRPLLMQYLESGEQGQTPMNIYNAFSFHKALKEEGDMRKAKMI